MPVDIALFSAMVILIVSQVVTPRQALAGFSNPAIFIIACFYVVSAAVRESGALHWWVMKLLGDDKSLSVFMSICKKIIKFSVCRMIFKVLTNKKFFIFSFK